MRLVSGRGSPVTRLIATLGCDVRLQFRNGFYYAAAFVAFFWLLFLSQAPAAGLAWLMPPFILSNLLINTFYFIGGLVLLEKGEGTVQAQIVTPLRSWEYLTSKIATLAVLSLAENLAIVGIAYGLGFNALLLIAGLLLAAAFYALLGFVLVARYDAINEYLFPSFFYTLAFIPPFLAYFGLWTAGWWVYLHPLQAPLLLIQAAFTPVETWQLLYGLLYAGLSVGLAFSWSRRAFHRFIIRAEGVH